MLKFIPTVFEVLGALFNKIPVLNKLKGYRSFLGLGLLAVVVTLDHFNVAGGGFTNATWPYIAAYTGLALNASGRLVK